MSLTILALTLASRHRLAGWLGRIPASVTVLFALAAIVTVFSLRATPTGDEPHYLIMTQSLLRDGDLDLRNNYERLDYLEYYPGPIPDSHVIVVGDEWYPVHGIGLPVVAAPWFAVAGRAGVVVMLALMTVAGVRIMWSMLKRAGFDGWSAGTASLAAGFTLPLASLSGQVYPEVPAFLLVALALHSILAFAMTRWDLGALILSVALLPWLHPKYAALSVALMLAAVLVQRGRLPHLKLALIALIFVGSMAGLAATFYSWYGAPLPPNIMPRVPGAEDWLASIRGHFLRQPMVGLSGALFDQQYGLFLASPVHVLVIPGLILLWRWQRMVAIASALVFLSVYLPAAAWGDWHGGWSSPARFLVPVVPVLAVGLGAVLQRAGATGRKLFALLAIPSVLHAYLMTTLPDFTRYGDPATYQNYFIALFERFVRLDLSLVFPSLKNVSQTTWMTLLIYLLAIALLTAIVLRSDVRSRAVKPL